MYDKAAFPLILYPGAFYHHPGQCDCDCACALDPPSVLAVQFASVRADCDCACALDMLHDLAVRSSSSHDCDCACALDVADGLVDYSATSTPWIKQVQVLSIPLEDGWKAYYNPGGPVGLVALNAAAQRVLAAFDSPILPQRVVEHLPGIAPAVLQDAVESLAQIGLLHPVAVSCRPPSRAPILSAWLHVTEACNLNCPYCYVHKRPASMSAAVGLHAVDCLVEMANRHGYVSLKLKYAGGEPTLRFPLIRAIHAHVACRATQAGLALEEVVLTNGVGVTDTMLDFLVEAGMQLMVSLDGGPDTHDRVRAKRDGGSSYASVTDTVERALERGLRPNVSITLTALNLDGALEAVAFALKRDLPFNLNFYRECTVANPTDMSSLLTPDSTQLVETMLHIFDLVKRYPTYSLPLTGILDRARLDIPHSYPCSAGRDYLAVDTEGRVSACQMLLERPWASLADDDPLHAIRQQGEDIFRAADEYPDCQICQWRMACSGGCPLLRETPLHDEYCQVYQTLFPELIRLEANRLIASQTSVVQ